MSRLRAAAGRFAGDARAAFALAPVEAALALGAALAVSLALRVDGFAGEQLRRLLAGVALAFPLVFALSAMHARGAVSAPLRWAGTAAALALAGVVGGWWLAGGRDAEWWRWSLLTGAALLLLLVAPALPSRGRDRRAVWAFAARLLARGVAVGVYAVALYALLAGAVAAVVSLFELRQPQDLYGDLAGWIFLALAPLILAGGIPRLVAPAEPGVPAAVGVLGRWLYAPALLVYLVILYAYGVRVLLTGELPRNLLSPLVIAAGAIGLLGAFLLEPVRESAEHRGLALLVRIVPLVLLPLVPLAVWGLAARVEEYGWTPFRYVRLALAVTVGLLAVAGTVRLFRVRPPLLTTIPAALAAVLLLSAVGPWSATAVSRRDQTARLRAAIAEAGVDARGLPADSLTLDAAAYARIDATAGYLARTHGFAPVRAVAPGFRGREEDRWSMGLALGLRRGCAPGERRAVAIDWRAPVPGVAAGSVQEVAIPAEGGRSPAGARLRFEGESVVAEGEGWRAEGALPTPFAAAEECEARFRGPDGHLPAADARVDLRDDGGTLRAQLVVTWMAAGEGMPLQLRGLLVLPGR